MVPASFGRRDFEWKSNRPAHRPWHFIAAHQSLHSGDLKTLEKNRVVFETNSVQLKGNQQLTAIIHVQ